MFMFQFTSRHKASKAPKALRPYHNSEVVTKMWAVFNNVNDNKLSIFFQDPFVRMLWQAWAKEHLAPMLRSFS